MIKNAKIVGAGIDPEDYLKQLQGVKRGDPQFVLNGGELSNFASNPARWLKGYETSGSKSTEFGDLVDCILLDPNRYEKTFVIAPTIYSTTGMECPKCGSVTDSQKCKKCKCDRVAVTIQKEWNSNATECQEWIAKQGNSVTIIKSDMKDNALSAITSIEQDEVALELLDCSEKQVMVVGEFEDKESGLSVPLKCLIDLVPAKDGSMGTVLADFKTARSGSPFAWPRAVYDFNYAGQAARELDLYNAATGENRDGFHHIICENVAPFAVATQFLSHEFIDAIGRARYIAALRFYCQCLKSNHWPGYREMAAQMGAVVIEGWVECKPEAWMMSKADYNAMLPANERTVI